MESASSNGARRQLASRNQAWAQHLARWVAGWGISPNAISLWSVGFSMVSAWALAQAGSGGLSVRETVICYLLAAGGIQMRLLCNLLDGMVAIEHGRKSATGGLYNEAPDRVADVLLLVAAGQSAGTLAGTALPLGWLAAVVAMATAYVRVLGGSLTGTQNFMGPMAKQHRMFLLTLGCLAGGWAALATPDLDMAARHLWPVVLHVIVLGAVLTCVRRLREMARLLNHPGPPGQPLRPE